MVEKKSKTKFAASSFSFFAGTRPFRVTHGSHDAAGIEGATRAS